MMRRFALLCLVAVVVHTKKPSALMLRGPIEPYICGLTHETNGTLSSQCDVATATNSLDGTAASLSSFKAETLQTIQDLNSTINGLQAWRADIDLHVTSVLGRVAALERNVGHNVQNISDNDADIRDLKVTDSQHNASLGQVGNVMGLAKHWSASDVVDGGFSNVDAGAWGACDGGYVVCRTGRSQQIQSLMCDNPMPEYGAAACSATTFPTLPGPSGTAGQTVAVPSMTTATTAQVQRACLHLSCCPGYYPSGERSEDCTMYEGTCDNGVLSEVQDRTQENQCATCNPGYGLNPTTKACDACVYLQSWSNATDARPCQPVNMCDSPATQWGSGGEYEETAPAPDATSDRVCGSHADACTDTQWQSKAPTSTSDRLCLGAGTCANGDLINLQSRTQANHCGDCDDGYFLYDKLCYPWTCSTGSGLTECATCAAQADRTAYDHCATCHSNLPVRDAPSGTGKVCAPACFEISSGVSNIYLGSTSQWSGSRPRGTTFTREVSFTVTKNTHYYLENGSIQHNQVSRGENAPFSPYLTGVTLDGAKTLFSGNHILRGGWYGGGGCGGTTKSSCSYSSRGTGSGNGCRAWPTNGDIDLGCLSVGTHTMKYSYKIDGSTCENGNIQMVYGGTLKAKPIADYA